MDINKTYIIYLSQEMGIDTLILNFPVNPESISVKYDIDNKKYNVLSIGDVMKIGDRGLKTFSFKSFFPFINTPEIYIAMIDKMIENKLPMRFVICRIDVDNRLFDFNILVIIDGFEYEEKGGEIGDLYYTLKFTEYREHKAVVVGV